MTQPTCQTTFKWFTLKQNLPRQCFSWWTSSSLCLTCCLFCFQRYHSFSCSRRISHCWKALMRRLMPQWRQTGAPWPGQLITLWSSSFSALVTLQAPQIASLPRCAATAALDVSSSPFKMLPEMTVWSSAECSDWQRRWLVFMCKVRAGAAFFFFIFKFVCIVWSSDTLNLPSHRWPTLRMASWLYIGNLLALTSVHFGFHFKAIKREHGKLYVCKKNMSQEKQQKKHKQDWRSVSINKEEKL